MNINKEYLTISITFPKPIIERDDGQNINSCMATHSEETRMVQSVTPNLQSIFTRLH